MEPLSATATPLRSAAPATVVGTVCVVAGGLVAAVTARDPSQHATWAAAYLVLVAGVAQVGLGIGQAVLSRRVPPSWARGAELLTWNVGNGAVIAGVVLGVTGLVDLGGLLLVVALALVIAVVRGGSTRTDPADRIGRLTRRAFQLLVLILLVSIPVGLWLARQPTP